MTFEYLSETDVEERQEVALLGMGSLATMKLGDTDGEYQPPADELVVDLEAYLKNAAVDPERNPDDPIVPNMMSMLYGFSYVWTCEYRWAKNPLGLPYAADVIVSPDERHYLNPLDLVLSFLEDQEPDLSQLLIDAFHGNFPEGETPMLIPTED